MEAEPQIQVTPAARKATAEALARAGLTAPLCSDTPERIVAGGECFDLETASGRCAFVVRRDGPVLWIDGAGAVVGQGFTGPGLDLCKEIARQCGCTELAFETSRPGLVRMAREKGFEVVGYILKAQIQ